MTQPPVLSELTALGVVVWADGCDLRFRAPRGVVTHHHKTRLAAAKPQILAYLRQNGPNLAGNVSTLSSRLYSRVLGETVAVVPDDAPQPTGPEVVYRASEVEELRDRPPQQIQAIHAVKKAIHGLPE